MEHPIMARISFKEGIPVRTEEQADLNIQGPVDIISDLSVGRSIASARLRTLIVEVHTSDCDWSGLMPPLDEEREPAFARVPRLPGASVRVQTRLTTPAIDTFERYVLFRDGRLVASSIGRIANPEVTLECRLEDMLLMRSGLCNVVDMFDKGAKIGGISFGHMSTFAGIIDSDEYRTALRSCCFDVGPLVAWLLLLRRPGVTSEYVPIESGRQPDDR